MLSAILNGSHCQKITTMAAMSLLFKIQICKEIIIENLKFEVFYLKGKGSSWSFEGLSMVIIDHD